MRFIYGCIVNTGSINGTFQSIEDIKADCSNNLQVIVGYLLNEKRDIRTSIILSKRDAFHTIFFGGGNLRVDTIVCQTQTGTEYSVIDISKYSQEIANAVFHSQLKNEEVKQFSGVQSC